MLEASAAARYVNFSTFGGNWTYKFGARYTPVRDLTVRGTYSTGFRAPNVSELYLGATENDPSPTDPCAAFSKPTPAAAARSTTLPPTRTASPPTPLQQ